MEITSALVADLTILTETLGDPAVDIADTLRRLAADTKIAVDSFLGLAVTGFSSGRGIVLTTLGCDTDPGQILASLRLPPRPVASSRAPAVPITVILYAENPGAFGDLAADLAWLTGQPLAEFVLDQDRSPPTRSDAASGLDVDSVINQAIGVLIGRGYTPEQADRELGARAARLGVDRHNSGKDILAESTRSTGERP